MKLSMLFLRPRLWCLLSIIAVLLLIFFEILFQQILADLGYRIHYFTIINKTQQKENLVLLQYLVNLTTAAAITNYGESCYIGDGFPETTVIKGIKNIYVVGGYTKDMIRGNGGESSLLNALSDETKMILRITTGFQFKIPPSLQLPRVYILPQLLSEPMSLQLSYLLTKNRTGFSMVLGIPTVKRSKENYLLSTLKSIIKNMKYEEQQKTLIVICIGETDMDIIMSIVEIIQDNFIELIGQGLIDIIAPLQSYYPDFSKLRITLNDKLERVQWRSKENLDTSLLMAYAKSKGKFYVQLEDDIIAKRGFINTMLKYQDIISLKDERKSWFVLDFCRFGSIGKMFKSYDLPWLITYIQIYFNEKPIDWLIKDCQETKFCNCLSNYCKHILKKKSFIYKRSQFQHVGKFSSLDGKLQNITDTKY